MNEEDLDMFETFKRLTPESRVVLLTRTRAALAIDDTTMRTYGYGGGILDWATHQVKAPVGMVHELR